ncbi:hypothetical protein B5M42_019815 [Paenibacillus athensensis]|uniref:Uncharacterized protein n=1 Tax=Paenibacillus athensensis TaxID=1967502 RepID=A0A4Y8Q1X8_9BACL|nr:hypothetical protein [Paenibacillus athensensis]MCD1261055.1 hypothetical protein [Paenibacillus athensensis]
MQTVLLGLAIFAVVMLMVARPLWTRNPAAAPGIAAAASVAEQQRVEAMMTLNELEYDYRMNKLSADDYEKLAAPYRKLAAASLEQAASTSKLTQAVEAGPTTGLATAFEAQVRTIAEAGAQNEAADGLSSGSDEAQRKRLEEQIELELQKKMKERNRP